MIKVLYDHQMFSLQRYGGVSRYFANLYTSFKKGTEVRPSISALYSKNHYIEEVTLASPHWFWQLLLRKKRRMYKWNRWYSKKQLRKQDFNLFHPTYYDPYFFNELKKPYVITVHDMIYELFPQYFNAGDMFVIHKRRVIENAHHIISISHSTKQDLMRLYGIADSKITVVHLGFLQELSVDAAEIELPEKYILFVGERTNYKNFQRFTEALIPVFQKYSDVQLICTGGNAFKKEELEFFQEKGIDKKVQQVSASDQLMTKLYRNALVFVFPSLYEGFGLPLLEAFSNNCPVACSNTSSFTEVCGNAVLYFDPIDRNSISQAISSILENPSVSEELRFKGSEQLKKFTIDKCVEQTTAVYKHVLS